MKLIWTFEGRTLSDEDKFKPGGVLDTLQLPTMLKLETKAGQEEEYVYIDYGRLLRNKRITPTALAYVLKKGAGGIHIVDRDGDQGLFKAPRSGGVKLKYQVLGDSRLVGYTCLHDKANKKKLYLLDELIFHESKEEADFHGHKDLRKTVFLSVKNVEEEVKEDGDHSTSSGHTIESFNTFVLTYDRELLRAALSDEEGSYRNKPVPVLQLLESLVRLHLPNNGYSKLDPEGVTLDKWDEFFSLTLEQMHLSTIENSHPGSCFGLLGRIFERNSNELVLRLDKNKVWREEFWKIILLQEQNPLGLLFRSGEINAELFKRIVSLKPDWLLGMGGVGGHYFKRLAIYLKMHQDPILHSVFTSNLSLLRTQFKRSTYLEVLTRHFLSQKPFDLKHCDYLGLKEGFRGLAQPFQESTNLLIIPLITGARSLEDKLSLLEFFSPCLRLEAKSLVLQHLIEPGTINTCDQAVIKLFDEISSNFELFSKISKEYLDNNGNNWLIYDKFLNHPQSAQFGHAPKLLERLMTSEGGHINNCDQEKVWSLFEKEQGDIFLENFDIYLNRGGNDGRVYYKFLDEFKGDLLPYAPRLFLRLVALGQDKLLTKFTSTEIDLTQTIEALKAGRLNLPVLEAKASPTKRESLSKILKIEYVLAKESIQFLMEKSDRDIIIFCLTDGDEDLKLAILKVYQGSLSQRRKDSFSKALTINPKLTAKGIILLTKATDREIIDFCLTFDNKVARIEILKAYKDRLYHVELSTIEILTLLDDEEVVDLFSRQIEKVGYRSLFAEANNFPSPARLVRMLFTGHGIAKEEMEQLREYKWSQEVAEWFLTAPLSIRYAPIKVSTVIGPDGTEILSIKGKDLKKLSLQDKNLNDQRTNSKHSIPQSSSSNAATTCIKIVNGGSVALSSASRGIKFAEDPGIVRGLELGANLLLLGCIVFPDSRIGKKVQYLDIASKGAADIGRHGIINATFNLISNVGSRYIERLFLPIYVVPLLLTTVVGFYYSLEEFISTVHPYFNPISNASEQCEILLALEFGYTVGTTKAIFDNLAALKARGYSAVLLGESYEMELELKSHGLIAKQQISEAYENAKINYANDTDLLNLYADMIARLQVDIDIAYWDLRVYRQYETYSQLRQYSDNEVIASISRQAEKICSEGHKKQIILMKYGYIKQLIEFLQNNFKVASFAVWSRKGACNRSFKQYAHLGEVAEVEGVNNEKKCQIRNAEPNLSEDGKVGLVEVTKKFGLSNVLILDQYKYPQLNSTKTISISLFKYLDASAGLSKKRAYFEMTTHELQEAAMVGNEELQYFLGAQFKETGRLDLAEQWCRRAAVQGHIKANVMLASLLMEMPERREEARPFAQKASFHGSRYGQWVYGKILEELDDKLFDAEELYQESLKQGYETARTDLERVRNKIEEAKKNQESNGNKEIQYDFGLYEKKKNNFNEAELWFRKSAEQGFGKSQAELAMLLFSTSPLESHHWAQKASDNGMMEGQHLVAVSLIKARDLLGAKRLLELSAAQGYKPAQELLPKIDIAIYGMSKQEQESRVETRKFDNGEEFAKFVIERANSVNEQTAQEEFASIETKKTLHDVAYQGAMFQSVSEDYVSEDLQSDTDVIGKSTISHDEI